MEKQLSYNSLLSLKEIALRRMVVRLWNESDIIALIGEFQLDCREIWQKTIEDKVVDKVSKLVLPGLLSKQIIDIVKPIGLQIRKWKSFHESYLSDPCKNLNVPILELLIWTSAGTIDYRKTAEELVCCNIVDIVKRYKLACLYCLDDYIPVIWKKLSEPIRTYFYNEENFLLMEEPHLQFCWPYILKGEQSKLDNMPGRLAIGNQITFHQYAFEYSAFKGNKTAAEYFFQKLTIEEREASLIQTVEGVVINRNNNIYKYNDDFPKEALSEVLYYLLSVMTPDQQMQILKEQPWEVLPCFFDWRWQDYFLQIAEHIWTFLPKSYYHDLLYNIFRIIKNSGYYFPRLFQEFFLHSPIEFRDEFLGAELIFGNFFTECLNVQDSETIEVIFRNIRDEDRMRLVSSFRFFELFDGLIMGDKWHLVELCLREATLSKEDAEKLKKVFMKLLAEAGKLPKEWKRFFRLLNEIYGRTANKRRSGVKILTKAKKLLLKE